MSSEERKPGPRRWIDPQQAWSRWGGLADVRVVAVEPHGSRAEPGPVRRDL